MDYLKHTDEVTDFWGVQEPTQTHHFNGEACVPQSFFKEETVFVLDTTLQQWSSLERSGE